MDLFVCLNAQLHFTMRGLDKIVKKAEEKRESPSLKHVLAGNHGAKYGFQYKVEDGQLVYSFDEIGDTRIRRTEIFIDELSKEPTAYISVPIEYLFHDDALNPRGLNSSVRTCTNNQKCGIICL